MNKRRLKRVRFFDAVAKRLIAATGVSVIGCVLLMLVLIATTALPLFRPASAAPVATLPAVPDGPAVLVSGTDDDATVLFTLNADAQFRLRDLVSGAVLETRPLRAAAAPPAHLRRVETVGALQWSLLFDDSTASLAKLRFAPPNPAKGAHPQPVLILTFAPALPANTQANVSLVRATDDQLLRASLLADGTILVQLADPEDEEVKSTDHLLNGDHRDHLTAITADSAGANIYAGTTDGRLLHWTIEDGEVKLTEQLQAFPDNRTITALGPMFGDVSLAVGDNRGEVSTWCPVAFYGPGSERQLLLVHRLSSHDAPVTEFRATSQDKCLFSRSEKGMIRLDHMTSERSLLTFPASAISLTDLQLSRKGDTLTVTTTDGRATVYHVRNPHPEISWGVLFSKVLYESHDEPAYSWQSSSGNDDFEPKLSFVPLLFGSLKGTFYAMLFAVPLALFGALYTSQFTVPAIRNTVKPLVEVMAAVPSVVIGFLAALWLAPRLERAIVPVLLFLVLLPALIMLFLPCQAALRRFAFGRRIERGYEFLAVIPLLAFTAWFCQWLAPWVEARWFNGDFALWLFQEGGSRFDQRNSMVIAFALGFAVIPIVFSMTEDALSNVPKSLKAASLALGASRWQTVWRVVLPSASPGIFAAMIVGFGRAVGETMIVLMATGNTPVLDWGPFSGMRTLAANIAVEIPEAPVGGTLYRTLFLSAVLLFLLTSVLNTAAEWLRHHLRKKYQY